MKLKITKIKKKLPLGDWFSKATANIFFFNFKLARKKSAFFIRFLWSQFNYIQCFLNNKKRVLICFGNVFYKILLLFWKYLFFKEKRSYLRNYVLFYPWENVFIFFTSLTLNYSSSYFYSMLGFWWFSGFCQ